MFGKVAKFLVTVAWNPVENYLPNYSVAKSQLDLPLESRGINNSGMSDALRAQCVTPPQGILVNSCRFYLPGR